MKTKLLFVILMIFGFEAFSQITDEVSSFEGKEYKNCVNFRYTEFDSTANFESVHFDSTATFKHAKFLSSISFEQTQFHSNAYFSDAHFLSLTSFSRTHFDSIATFDDAISFSNCRFTDSEFHSDGTFSKALFLSSADFRGASFYSNANFYYTKFCEIAKFDRVLFYSQTIFNKTHFDSIASFRYVIVKEGIDFTDCTLPYYLDLSGIQLKGDNLDLTHSIVNYKYGKCLINLVNVDIEKLKLRYSMFELRFPYDDAFNSDMKTNIYEQLLKNQKEYGFTSSYEKLDKEYMEYKYLKSGKYSFIGGWILNMVNKYWWGYGYDKMLIIRNTLYIFVLFSIINCIFFPWILNIYEVPNIKILADAVTAKNVILQRIKIVPIAFFYTGLIFFGLKFSTENLKYKENLVGWRFFNLVYFFVIYISGLVCLGYLANFILST